MRFRGSRGFAEKVLPPLVGHRPADIPMTCADPNARSSNSDKEHHDISPILGAQRMHFLEIAVARSHRIILLRNGPCCTCSGPFVCSVSDACMTTHAHAPTAGVR